MQISIAVECFVAWNTIFRRQLPLHGPFPSPPCLVHRNSIKELSIDTSDAFAVCFLSALLPRSSCHCINYAFRFVIRILCSVAVRGKMLFGMFVCFRFGRKRLGMSERGEALEEEVLISQKFSCFRINLHLHLHLRRKRSSSD